MPEKNPHGQNSPVPSHALFRGTCLATVFLGAWLLFQIQPLLSKAILPWFGGTPAVWTTCMLFFQSLLLAGYAVAHFVSQRRQMKFELAVLVLLACVAVVMLPILPRSTWKPSPGIEPIGWILALLAFTIGPAYLLLSTTSPLTQVWWSRASRGASPYRLYALSNAGSLLALLTYPFLIEPWLGVGEQALWWSVLFVFYVFFLLSCQVVSWRGESQEKSEAGASSGHQKKRVKKSASRQVARRSVKQRVAQGSPLHQRSPSAEGVEASENPTWAERLVWLLLSACGSVLLLATTNAICQDVAVVPLLWIAPLSLYLLTFILAFDNPRWYHRGLFVGLSGLFLGVLLLGLALSSPEFPKWFPAWEVPAVLENYLPSTMNLISYSVFALLAFFSACLVCHGELARLRPSADRLTSFYLYVATGGALGGVLVGVLAPALLNDYDELPLGITAFWLLTLGVLMRDPRSRIFYRRAPRVCFAIGGALVLPVCMGLTFAMTTPGNVLDVRRNFYGVLTVIEQDTEYLEWGYYELSHGSTIHGAQFQDPVKRREPTSYYGRQSGIGLAMAMTEKIANRRVGLVGLGAGTLATYGKAGDTFQFYEINPVVETLARHYFTYLEDSEADCRVALGDARLTLEASAPQAFDLLVLDAFSSDSIPIHLITQEAFSQYLRHLAPGGGDCCAYFESAS